MMQPIAADDVAAAVAKVALEEPLNGMIEWPVPNRSVRTNSSRHS